LQAFINAHRKSFFSVNLSCVSSVDEKNPVGRPSKTVKPTEKKVTWAVSAGPIIQNEEKIEQQRRKDETFCLLTTIGVTQNASAYQDLATSNSNIYSEYTEISYRNG
jgi:hypothetical protein